MRGLRWRFSRQNREDLNSANGIATEGSFKRFLRCTALAVTLIGGTSMVPPTMKARAQESQTVRRIQQHTRELAPKFADVEKEFEQMDKWGSKPQLYDNHGKVIALRRSLEKYNKTLEAAGRPPIDIPTWGRDNPLTPKGLKALKKSVYEAGVSTSNPKSAQTVASAAAAIAPVQAPKEEPEKEQPPAPVAAPVRPPPSATVPAKISLKEKHAEDLKNLELLAEDGHRKSIRDRATALKSALEKQIEAGKVRQSTLASVNKLTTRDNLNRAEKSRLDAAPVEEAQLTEAEMGESEIQILRGRLDWVRTIFSRHEIGQDIRDLVPGAWRLGEPQRAEMSDHLHNAATALEQGNQDVFNSEVSKAQKIYDQDQKVLELVLEIAWRTADELAPISEARSGVISNSNLATSQEVENNREHFQDRVPRRIDISDKGVENVLRKRAKEARQQLDANRGRLSYKYVRDIADSILYHDYAVSKLISYWNYTRGHPRQEGTEGGLWRKYGVAAATIADPAIPDPEIQYGPYNPYEQYQDEPELVRTLVEEYKRATGNRNVSDEEAFAALLRAPRWKYDDVLYAFFEQVIKHAPPVSQRDKPAVSALAEVIAARLFVPEMYLGYKQEYEDPLYEFKNADQRVEDIRKELQRVLGYLPQTHDLRPYVEKWLADTENVANNPDISDEKKIEIADKTYEMTIAILPIRHLELLLSNSNIRRASATQADIRAAKQQLGYAKRAFLWNFSHPELDLTLYPIQVRKFANDGVILLSPRALAVTDQDASMYIRTKTQVRNTEEIMSLPETASAQEKRAAVIAARETAFNKSLEAATKYVSMLHSLREDDEFGKPAGTSVALNKTWSSAFRLLHPRAGRSNIIKDGFDIDESYEGEVERDRFTFEIVDDHKASTQRDVEKGWKGKKAYVQFATYLEGELFAEISRQNTMHDDRRGSPSLKNLNILLNDRKDSFTDRMVAVSKMYGDKTPEQILLQGNKVLVGNEQEPGMTKARIDEAIERAGARVAPPGGGRTCPIRTLKAAKDPRSYYVRRALDMMAVAQELHTDFNPDRPSIDLYEKPPDPGDAIRVAEMAEYDLSDKHVRNIPCNLVSEIEYGNVRTELNTEGRMQVAYFSLENLKAKVGFGADAETVSLIDYVKRYGELTLQVSYYYVSESAGKLRVLNPIYDPDDKSKGPRYHAVIMPDFEIRDPSTGKTKETRAIVLTHRPGEITGASKSETLVWEPRGREKGQEVLGELREGTYRPVWVSKHALSGPTRIYDSITVTVTPNDREETLRIKTQIRVPIADTGQVTATPLIKIMD